jgi:hypothetical protein
VFRSSLPTVSNPVSLATRNGSGEAKDSGVEEQEIRRISEDYPDWCISRLPGPAGWWKATRRGGGRLSLEDHRRGLACTLIEDMAERLREELALQAVIENECVRDGR